MKPVTLSPELEALVLGAMARGLVPLDVAKAEEFSKPGRGIYAGIDHLISSTSARPPLDLGSVATVAVEVFGQKPEEVRAVLKRIQKSASGAEVGDILQRVRDKQVIVDLINEGGRQLATGNMDPAALVGIVGDRKSTVKLLPASTYLTDGIPEKPRGPEIVRLPRIMRATGGVFGLWAIAGEPGIGKSGLVNMMTAELAEEHDYDVLSYDFENGPEIQLHRLGEAFGGDLVRLRALAEKLYIREDIRTLDADVAVVKPPAVIVVDSFQSLPTSVEHRRMSLDRWVVRFEKLVRRGYTVILVSEKAREQYGEANLAGFKETGEIEYKAWIGAHLLGEPDDDVIEFHLVKNRHRKTKGFVTNLARENDWSFREVGTARGEEVP